jgi:hypothetical protein
MDCLFTHLHHLPFSIRLHAGRVLHVIDLGFAVVQLLDRSR